MPTLSQRVQDLHASPIREILAVISKPGMISFAGGLPAPESFPLLELQQVPGELLQYGPSEGESALREQICLDLRQSGLHCDPSQVLVLSGSQQGIDLVGKLMVDSGTLLALENPTYLAALQVFRFFGARFASLNRQKPETRLKQADKPALCYVVPTFQNPTGYCYNQQERQALAAACEQQAVVLFEDDPYRDLAYETCDRQPICSLVKTGHWIYQGSFSKTIAPGLRLGFMAASKQLVPHLTRLKQAADLHSNRLSQHLILRALQHPAREQRLTALQASYRNKRDMFADELQQHLADFAQWDLPQGGLFFWLKLRHPTNTQSLLKQALAKGLAVMPGEPFFHTSQEQSYLRLNFSHADEAQMRKGIEILKNVNWHKL